MTLTRLTAHGLLWLLDRGPIARWLDDSDPCPRCGRIATSLRVEQEATEAATEGACHVA